MIRLTGQALATAALTLEGVPWRLHGRDPLHGLDCIGLLGAAMARAGHPVLLPSGYPLRLTRLDGWLPDPPTLGFAEATGPIWPGDVVLTRPGPAQFHLAIALTGDGGEWIHAHAGLRRVVRSPDLTGTPIARWRLTADDPQD